MIRNPLPTDLQRVPLYRPSAMHETWATIPKETIDRLLDQYLTLGGQAYDGFLYVALSMKYGAGCIRHHDGQWQRKIIKGS